MPKYNLCVIDDKIPVELFNEKIQVDDTSIIDQNILLNYLKFADETAWSDTNLYNLIKCLKEQTDIELYVSAFITHSFYLNYIDEHLFSPDIIIYDWDVNTPNIPSEASLKTILKKTHCLIAIYTGCDNLDEINAIIKSEIFKSYEYRIFVIGKNDANSAKVVIEELNNHLIDFSFSYGRNFKHIINAAINSAFCEIGELSFDQFVKVFGEFSKDEDKYKISSLDFIEIMGEQFKAQLLPSQAIEPLVAPKTQDNVLIERQLWHFRMFHKPQDDIVRKGDIVWHKTENKYYFIVSSDCHLSGFWSKNLGYLTIVPLYKSDDDSLLQRIKQFTHSNSIKQFKINSLVSPQMITNMTIIPCLDKKDDYILSPKEIKSINVQRTTDNKVLMYNDIPDFNPKNRFRLNEPFLGALIEYTLRNVTDIGVPDYSEQIKNILKGHIIKLGSSETNS
jgi:hypothetical protein